MPGSTLLWQPTDESIRATQMYAFMTRAAEKYGFSADWPSLHLWSVEHRDQFWQEMFDLAEIRPTRAASAVERGKGMLGTTWFDGLEFNFAAHLLRFNDDRVAIEAVGELGRTRPITYAELRGRVASFAAGLARVEENWAGKRHPYRSIAHFFLKR